jgi:cell wall-associated NlpC family hydrolase
MNNQAICTLSVIPMRKDPSDRSEMVNQVLFGETMEILDSNEKWYMVKLNHDNYEGWVDKKQVELFDSIPPAAPIVNTAPLFVVRNQNDGFSFLPSGAYINKVNETTLSAGKHLFYTSAQELINTAVPTDIALGAMIFLDTPYLWGGRTLMGIDCSGFTQLVYRISGKSLPRDAWQQAQIGADVAFLDEANTGDLAFFDNSEGKITHVGIVIAQKDSSIKTIIHASGKVRLDKLDHQGIFNVETGQYSHNLRMIKRID